MVNESDEEDCPLPGLVQSRNVACFAGFWCVYYLAAPISYVGVTHANLLKELGHSDSVANLPHAVYQWLTAFPVLVAWLLPQPRILKPLMVIPILAMAAASAAVALVMGLRLSATAVTIGVIAHGAVFGAANGVLITTLWEVLRRGVSTSRRGRTLGLTFGLGPLFACLGSLIQQSLFASQSWIPFSFGLAVPDNYLALFAGAVPLLLVTALLAAAFVVPLPNQPRESEPRWSEITAGLWHFVTYRPLAMGAVTYLLVYAGGNAIFDNVSMHAKDVLGEESAGTVGLQNFLRFGCKAVAGVFLGWLLARSHPKSPLVATTTILILALVWVLNANGWWYLASAGLLGAGELFGAYFPNYIATASSKSQVRGNIAYLSVLGALVGFASLIFGEISDRFSRVASFHTALGVLLAAMALIAVTLPARPVPHESKTQGG